MLPFYDVYDDDSSPELEAAYLRNGTFHTSIFCNIADDGSSSLRRFLACLKPALAQHIHWLQLRFPMDEDPDAVSFVKLQDTDRKRPTPLLPATITFNMHLSLRACTAELVDLFIQFGFPGRIALCVETSKNERVYDVTLVKLGLEVADKAWKRDTDKNRAVREVLKGEEMVAAVNKDSIPSTFWSLALPMNQHISDYMSDR